MVLRCGGEFVASFIEFALGGVGEADSGLEERQAEASAGGDHAPLARLEMLQCLD